MSERSFWRNSIIFNMSFRQLVNSVQQIIKSENTPTAYGLYKHSHWQIRKLFSLFPVELTLSESKIWVSDPKVDRVAALVNCMGMYDYNNMNLIKYLLSNNGGGFYDIGANVGTYTLIASEAANATVVSFEPHPKAFNILKNNITRQNRTNIFLKNIALSDKTGSLYLSNSTKLAINKIINIREDSIQVRSSTIDNIVKELKIYPNIIKIDVEGHEKQVLLGLYDSASYTNVIIVESGENPGIKKILDDKGFIGPLYFHYSKMLFTQIPQIRQEDPVYINKDFVPNLKEFGYSIFI